MDSFIFFLKQGFFHIFDWKSYDHILFLVVLTVVYTFSEWKKTLWLITLFTIGHTTSLIFSAYGVISVNKKIVEFLIPLTILITALANVFTTGKGNRKGYLNLNLMFALFFGLIHGLGFSSYFNMIISKGDSKLLPLLEFALGIEIAQLLIVFIILLLGFVIQTVFRFNKRDWVLVTSSIVIGFVIPMMVANKFW